jgi:hypothetical protein
VQKRRYEFRFLYDGEVIWTAQEVFADDLDALDEACLFAVAHDVQVWQGVTLVAHVKMGNKPLNERDPTPSFIALQNRL